MATQTQTRSCRAKQFYKPKDIPFYSMGFSRKRQPILAGLAKVCLTLAPNMQFYFYRIDKKVMGVVQNGQGHLPCCSAKKNGDSSKAWSWKSSKNGSGTALPNAKQTQAINQ
jgi:hypothetical protein